MNKQTPYKKEELQTIKGWVIESLAYLGYHDLINISFIQSTELLICHDVDDVYQILFDNNRIYIVDNKLQIKQFTIKNNKIWRLKTITMPSDMSLQVALKTIIEYHRLNIK